MIVSSSRSLGTTFELRVEDSSLRRNGWTLAEGINFTLKPGSLLVVMGASGVGKTSLLRALSGLDRNVRLDGSVSWKPYHPGGKVSVGLITQPNPIPSWITVGHYLWAHYSASPTRKADRRAKTLAEGACDAVGLEYSAIRRSFGRELSHGMRSRVALAGLYLLNSNINLIDEPFSGVDEPQRDTLFPRFREKLLGNGKIAVVVTHSPTEAISLGGEILFLRKGHAASTISIDRLIPYPGKIAIDDDRIGEEIVRIYSNL